MSAATSRHHLSLHCFIVDTGLWPPLWAEQRGSEWHQTSDVWPLLFEHIVNSSTSFWGAATTLRWPRNYILLLWGDSDSVNVYERFYWGTGSHTISPIHKNKTKPNIPFMASLIHLQECETASERKCKASIKGCTAEFLVVTAWSD